MLVKSAQLGTIRTKPVPAFVLFCRDGPTLCFVLLSHGHQDDHRRESAAGKAPDCSNCESAAIIQAKNTNVTEHKVAQIWKLHHTKALLFLLTVTLHMSLKFSKKNSTRHFKMCSYASVV